MFWASAHFCHDSFKTLLSTLPPWEPYLTHRDRPNEEAWRGKEKELVERAQSMLISAKFVQILVYANRQ